MKIGKVLGWLGISMNILCTLCVLLDPEWVAGDVWARIWILSITTFANSAIYHSMVRGNE
jgi:hypothetical protein